MEFPEEERVPNNSEVYNPEVFNMRPVFSDQELAYCARHNIWSPERIERIRKWKDPRKKPEDKRALMAQDELANLVFVDDNKTYSNSVHPLIPRTHKTVQTLNWSLSHMVGILDVFDYISAKKGDNKIRLEEFAKEGFSPYGHGSPLFTTIGSGIGSRGLSFDQGLQESFSKQSPTVLFLKHAERFLGSISCGLIMTKIDGYNQISFSEFEHNWFSAVEKYVEIVPLFITLLARDPAWNIAEMDNYIKSKNIPNIEELIPILSNEDLGEKMYELMRVIKNRDYTDEEREKIVVFYTAWNNVYGAMLEYLKEKVQYESD